jgi:predicted heme/steroid binding protein
VGADCHEPEEVRRQGSEVVVYCAAIQHNVILTQRQKNSHNSDLQRTFDNRYNPRIYIFNCSGSGAYELSASLVWNHAQAFTPGSDFYQHPQNVAPHKMHVTVHSTPTSDLRIQLAHPRWLEYLHVGRPRSSYPSCSKPE